MMNNNLDLLIKNTLFLQAQKQQLDLNKQELEEKIKIAKTWLAKKPEYLQFLQLLQRELHKKNIGVFGEVGAYYTGNPTATLQNVNGGTATNGSGASLNDEIAKEERNIENKSKYEWMPVAKVGVSFSF